MPCRALCEASKNWLIQPFFSEGGLGKLVSPTSIFSSITSRIWRMSMSALVDVGCLFSAWSAMLSGAERGTSGAERGYCFIAGTVFVIAPKVWKVFYVIIEWRSI